MSLKSPLWIPTDEVIGQSNLHKLLVWLSHRGKVFSGYPELWTWSANNPEEFWGLMIEYFDLKYSGELSPVTKGTSMPGVSWFDNMRVSYAEHVFRNSNEITPAIIHGGETTAVKDLSWKELEDSVAGVAACMKDAGVHEGDRVAAYLTCCPEATIGFLAANSLGAVWCSCSPDFGVQAVLDRFQQTEPTVLIACSGYNYGGKFFDKDETITALTAALPCLKRVIILSEKNRSDSLYVSWKDALLFKNDGLHFNRTAFGHPIWILFSSGTTGLPKAITHSAGGILIEHLKYLTFHNDLHPGERLFWYTTTGWMMWNYLQSTLLCGASMVLFDGSPSHPDLGRLWRFIDEAAVNHFGTSAGFILACKKADIKPSEQSKFSTLRSIGSTGSTLPPEGFEWIYRQIKKDVWLTSMSGGTDMATAFVGGNPLLPVYPGEIQCRALGCNLQAWNESAESVINEEGEMVITMPMPSMPVYFWNDPDFRRYKESYFDVFPGVWRHGDWIKITEDGGVIIYGRSDATLNRGGIRIGTSEIYRAVDKVKEVKDALMVCIEKGNGDFYMPLFVVMNEPMELSDDLKKKINQVIRTDNTPRHVPDDIVAVPDIPYTISGKKTETPVKKILMGKDPAKVINAGSLRNPDSLNFFAAFQKKINT
jgi:acetoacetyl-CoA synthetase